MFICNHCPFVIHVNTTLVEMANEYQAKGINFIAISSNEIENYPQDGPDGLVVDAEGRLTGALNSNDLMRAKVI